MDSKRKYGQYLWDKSAEVPIRSKHRFKLKASTINESGNISRQKECCESAIPGEGPADVQNVEVFSSRPILWTGQPVALGTDHRQSGDDESDMATVTSCSDSGSPVSPDGPPEDGADSTESTEWSTDDDVDSTDGSAEDGTDLSETQANARSTDSPRDDNNDLVSMFDVLLFS